MDASPLKVTSNRRKRRRWTQSCRPCRFSLSFATSRCLVIDVFESKTEVWPPWTWRCRRIHDVSPNPLIGRTQGLTSPNPLIGRTQGLTSPNPLIGRTQGLTSPNPLIGRTQGLTSPNPLIGRTQGLTSPNPLIGRTQGLTSPCSSSVTLDGHRFP